MLSRVRCGEVGQETGLSHREEGPLIFKIEVDNAVFHAVRLFGDEQCLLAPSSLGVLPIYGVYTLQFVEAAQCLSSFSAVSSLVCCAAGIGNASVRSPRKLKHAVTGRSGQSSPLVRPASRAAQRRWVELMPVRKMGHLGPNLWR